MQRWRYAAAAFALAVLAGVAVAALGSRGRRETFHVTLRQATACLRRVGFSVSAGPARRQPPSALDLSLTQGLTEAQKKRMLARMTDPKGLRGYLQAHRGRAIHLVHGRWSAPILSVAFFASSRDVRAAIRQLNVGSPGERPFRPHVLGNVFYLWFRPPPRRDAQLALGCLERRRG